MVAPARPSSSRHLQQVRGFGPSAVDDDHDTVGIGRSRCSIGRAQNRGAIDQNIRRHGAQFLDQRLELHRTEQLARVGRRRTSGYEPEVFHPIDRLEFHLTSATEEV